MKGLALSLMFFGVLISSNSYANLCTGKLDNIILAQNGRISIKSMELYQDDNARDICRLDAAWNGVHVEMCKAWLSALMISYTAGKDIRIYYPGTLTCPNVGTWESAVSPNSIQSQ